jgi:DNA N-6-adenine-methyltransferase (Dam).
MLIPARTNTGWWHDHCMKGEIRFLRGRPKFNDGKHGLPFPLALVIFYSSNTEVSHDAKRSCDH